MRATLFFVAAPALVLAAPETAPKITSLKFSGTGCPNNSGSVKAVYGELGDAPAFTFSQLKGADTDNCELHVQSSGGNVQLSSGSQLDAITQAFWSDHAADTSVLKGSVTCAGPDIKDYVTVRASTNDLKWSKCTGADGNPGILNVNVRPVVQGNSGNYDISRAIWGLQWRRC
ncbi:hypothetical protein N0V90_006091 [Kalmusia sp. IMI 367209]|nr:hypothetical protein N0V90_006091 [Kalmusia sp. IMI 367209]